MKLKSCCHQHFVIENSIVGKVLKKMVLIILKGKSLNWKQMWNVSI